MRAREGEARARQYGELMRAWDLVDNDAKEPMHSVNSSAHVRERESRLRYEASERSFLFIY